MSVPLVAPAPPRIAGRLPYVGAGPAFLANPTGFLRRTRARVGDSFLVEAFGFRLFFLFSPEGLRSLYQLPEKEASFTEATRRLIGFKLPADLLGGDALRVASVTKMRAGWTKARAPRAGAGAGDPLRDLA